MELETALTQGLTYLAALALPLWLLGEQLAGWWLLRKPTTTAEPKADVTRSTAPVAPRLERKVA
jgi:hypothetical protein